MATHNIKFPSSQKVGNNMTIYYNNDFAKKFNENFNKTQTYTDKLVGSNLQRYVSKKSGTQESSIVNANTYGKGYVLINVPYAEYQAYSKRIKKRVGLRGTQPFERMKVDKKDTILSQVTEYTRRLNG